MKSKLAMTLACVGTIIGCSGGEEERDLRQSSQLATGSQEEIPYCQIDESVPDLLLEMSPQVSGQRFGLNLLSLRDRPGQVTVSATVSFDGIPQRQLELWRGDVGAQQGFPFEVDFADLELPEVETASSGVLQISAEGRMDNGTTLSANTLVVSFHWNASLKRWLAYDSQEKKADYRNGELRPSRFRERHLREITQATGHPLDVEFVPVTPTTTEDEGGGTADPESPSGMSALSGEATTFGLGGSGRFCFNVTTTYEDAGDTGEDFWTSTTYSRPARGIAAYVFEGSNVIWGGWLGDGISTGDEGCTPYEFTSGTYTLYLTSSSYLNGGNRVETLDDSTSALGVIGASATHSGSGTTTVTMTAGSSNHQMNVQMAAAYAIWRHAGGMAQTYSIRSDDATNGSLYLGSGDVRIAPSHWDNKFVIVHEMGHAIGDFGTGGKLVSGDVSLNNSTCPATANSHSIGSKEWVSGAVIEGWAHFFAADVFNSHDETDCAFEYYKLTNGDSSPALDCETGGSPYVNAYMENVCGGTVDNRGVELDWLRQFWDVHTNGGGVSFNTMLNTWIDNANAWTKTTAYDELNAESNTVGGTLDSNWDNTKGLNGVDH